MIHFFRKKSPAFSLVEVVLALLIMLTTVGVVWQYIDMGLVAKQQRSVADHLQAVNTATSEYIKLHHLDLLNTTTKTSGITLTIQNLIDEELLPLGFSHKNAWGHDYNIYLRQPKTSKLQGIVLTKNTIRQDNKFNNVIVPSTASLLGGSGAYIATGLIPNQTANHLIGSHNSWSINLNELGINSTGAGHLGAITTFSTSELGLDFLYRFKVPGEPELNAMQTELDMTDNGIKNIKELQFVSNSLDNFTCHETSNQGKMFFDEKEGLYICREDKAVLVADTSNSVLFKGAMLVSHGDRVTKPLCPAGLNLEPQIFISPSILATGAKATPLASIQAWATDLNDTEWQINLRLLSKNEDWIYPHENYAKAMVFSTCTPNSHENATSFSYDLNTKEAKKP